MNTKHTPGPWHWNKELSKAGTQMIFGSDKKLIANCGSYARAESVNELNAHVITAAPEMLAELKQRVGDCSTTNCCSESFCESCQKTNQVIAKAEGRS